MDNDDTEFGFGDLNGPTESTWRNNSFGSACSVASSGSFSSQIADPDPAPPNNKLKHPVIAILGHSGVGKTPLAVWEVYKKKVHAHDTSETIKEIMSVTNQNDSAPFQLIDLGYEQFSDEERDEEYERTVDEANGFILVYDVTKRDSFEFIKYLLTMITQRKKDPDWSCVVIANSFHIKSGRNSNVDSSEARELCQSFATQFVEMNDVGYLNTSVASKVIDALSVSDTMVGYLDKQGGGQSTLGRKNWKRRWFILDKLSLTYQTRPESHNAKGRILAEDMKLVRDGDKSKPTQFVLVTKNRELVIEANNTELKNEWMKRLTNLIQRQGQFRQSMLASKFLASTDIFKRFSSMHTGNSQNDLNV